MMVNVFCVPHMVLHSGSVTAGKIFIVIAVFLLGSWPDGKHVGNAVKSPFLCDRILAGGDMV